MNIFPRLISDSHLSLHFSFYFFIIQVTVVEASGLKALPHNRIVFVVMEVKRTLVRSIYRSTFDHTILQHTLVLCFI